MDNQTYAGEMEKWLEHSETQNVLSRVAWSVMRCAAFKNLSLSFLGYDANWHELTNDLWKDIRSEIVLFILENRTRIQKILILENKNGHLYLRKAFLNYWIEKTRKSFRDPQRYLYKHAADVLRASETLLAFAGTKGTVVFSMSADSILIPPLSQEDIREIPFPDQVVGGLDYGSVNKKKVLLELAAHFLSHLSGMWDDQPVCADLRDFINWIGLHISIKVPMPVNALPERKDISELVPDHRPTAENVCFDPFLIRRWAFNFANRLNQKERAVFMLRHGHNMRLKDIAKELGYKGSSGPKYPLGSAERKLRFFLRDLPWLSPDDLNEEAFSLFHDTLFAILEKDDSPPG